MQQHDISQEEMNRWKEESVKQAYDRLFDEWFRLVIKGAGEVH